MTLMTIFVLVNFFYVLSPPERLKSLSLLKQFCKVTLLFFVPFLEICRTTDQPSVNTICTRNCTEGSYRKGTLKDTFLWHKTR